MQFVTVRAADGRIYAGRVEGDEVVALPYGDVGELLAAGGGPAAGEATGPRQALDAVELAPVVPRPGKVICVGLNYAPHAAEAGQPVPAAPALFSKYTESLIGPRDPIVIPSAAPDQVDWEVELVAVIGRTIRHAGLAEAEAAIGGFTVGNDVSMRDYQRRTRQWLSGKTWERSTPIGPVLVTPDELGGPTPDLRLTLDVDGERMQDSRTRELILNTPELIVDISTIITLRPGDIIFTGTPAGIGSSRKPPVYLRPGQTVTAAIEGIGELVNVCEAESTRAEVAGAGSAS